MKEKYDSSWDQGGNEEAYDNKFSKYSDEA